MTYTAVYGPCIRHDRYAAVTCAYVYTAVKRPRTRHVHIRVDGQYTDVYMPGRPTRPCTRAETARYGRGPCTNGRIVPCTRSCTRPIHSRVHVRPHGPCTRPRTRTACRNGPHTTVACRLGTCTRPGRPTCRIHGPDGPCIYTAEYTGRYTAVYALCRRPIRRVHGPIHDTLHGRVDGRFRPCRWPVHGRVTRSTTRPLYT